MSDTHTPEIPPHIVEEIGRLVTVGNDWAGTLARLLHGAPPASTPFGEETILAWAAGLETMPNWAVEPMARLLRVRAALLRQEAERCEVLTASISGGT